MLNNNDLIKVHVTQVQREYLEFLVNRRINDLQRHTWGNTAPQSPAELDELRKIKAELTQAGT